MNNENQAGLGSFQQADMNKAAIATSGYMQQLSLNPPRCECHECTQARWRMSIGGLNGLGQRQAQMQQGG